MSTYVRFVCFSLLVSTLVATPSWAENNRDDATFALVNTVRTQAKLAVDQKVQQVDGKFNILIEGSPELARLDIWYVRDISLALFGVDYGEFGAAKDQKKSSGVVGFTLERAYPGQKTMVRYDHKSNTLRGQLRGVVDSALLSSVGNTSLPGKRENIKGSDEHLFAVPTQKSLLNFELKLRRPLPRRAIRKPIKVPGTIKYEIIVEESPDYKMPSYVITGIFPWKFDFIPLRFFEVVRKLCLQPVRIQSSATDPDPTGDGLAFGLPGAETQWGKADVIFDVRDWQTVTNEDWKISSSDDEEDDIRASVKDDDCIEIFFVENNDPVSDHGGGATWGGGLASSQIITSDGNNNGIDFTHLAHELGHVMGLAHPGMGTPNANWPNLIDPSSGTLMCGSGWMNDNPAINSQENKDNISNPLFTFSFEPIDFTHDCADSADCGACF
ncbi:MAG: hypothetical protein HOH56_04255 [Acidiferrobacteraceae bacterium]|nr:hypothetical protein [Acidiferrobacteraceae bacterium]MBT5886989.1 hypothetical protein [Acidiferrobacteraceae bacterium]